MCRISEGNIHIYKQNASGIVVRGCKRGDMRMHDAGERVNQHKCRQNMRNGKKAGHWKRVGVGFSQKEERKDQ